MKYENFVYWLRGFLEVANPDCITKEQIDIINAHLNLCLNNVIKCNVSEDDKAAIKKLYTQNNNNNTQLLTDMSHTFILNGGSC